MKKASPLLLALLVATAQASVDLTPIPGERVLAGIKFQQLIFQEKGRKITYEQPRGWKYSGGGASIKFSPPELANAEAEIDQTPLQAPQNFDEKTMKALEEQVLSSVPANSQNAALVGTEKNPVTVNRHETFEVVVAYQISGVEFQRSVLFLNLPDTQLRFRVTARKQDFEKIHKAFRGSIYSWQWN